jgi:RNA polymerase sigma factor (sigma-70 family)
VRDPDSFSRALGPLLSRSAAYGKSLLGSKQDAEDAVQQAALRAWECIGQYDPVRPFKGWWFAIVHNCCMDILRQRRRTPKADSLEDIEVPAAGTDVPQGGLPLEEALLKLSDAHREILRFRYFADLSYAEIAAALRIPMGTVMSRLHLARMALAALFPREEP